MNDHFRILVVDDNEDNRYTLIRRLERDGYKDVLSAVNGEDALNQLHKEPFDLVLLDIMMPVLSGVEALKAIREHEGLRDLPVVMISALNDVDMIAKCIELGAEDFLTKPFNPTLLRARVASSLEKSRLRRLERVYAETHDRLTGLPNQVAFIGRLAEAYLRNERSGIRLSVVVIRLDQYRSVVEGKGRADADQVITEVCNRLHKLVRRFDITARIGNGEFAVLVQDVDDDRFVPAFADRVRHEVGKPILLGDTELRLTCSIGIALSDQQAGGSAERLLRDADLASDRAKRNGGDRFELFDSEMHARAAKRLQIESDLRTAIERGQFLMFYQPVIKIEGGALEGFEALIRWQHPQRGLVPPDDFIPIAEETGLISQIGEFALRESARQLAEWRGQQLGPTNLWVSVNVSAKQVEGGNLVALCDELATTYRIPPPCLKLEITETAIVGDPTKAAEVLNQLNEKSFGVVIDDFGTGHSALGNLHRFPFQILKIDRFFVRQMHEGKKQFEIVRSIALLAHNLDMKLVAEGVEDSKDLLQLDYLGCHYAQGYHFAKPMPANEAEQLLVAESHWPMLDDVLSVVETLDIDEVLSEL